MRRIKFYLCKECGNVLTETCVSDIFCCGEKLTYLKPQKIDKNHEIKVETIEEDFYIKFFHEMTKEHYINFLAYVSLDRFIFINLYPEQSGEVRLPKIPKGKLYFGCNLDGLWSHSLN